MGQFTRGQWLLLGINAISVLGFGSYYVSAGNAEFVAYAVSIVVVIGFLYATLAFTRFPTYLLAGVTGWAFLHMMGGSVPTPDGVLYAWKIYPFFDGGGDFYILKMDQVIHAYLYGVVALMFLHIIREVVGVQGHRLLMAFIAAFAAAGFSILNEVIEFWAAMNVPGNGVGGYENTVLDLIFNLSGALVAVLLYTLIRRNI